MVICIDDTNKTELRKRIKRGYDVLFVWDILFHYLDLHALSRWQKSYEYTDSCLPDAIMTDGRHIQTYKDGIWFLSLLEFAKKFGKAVKTPEKDRPCIAWRISPKLLLTALLLTEQSPETFMKVAEAAETPEMFLQLAGVELE